MRRHWRQLVYRTACHLAGHLPTDYYRPIGPTPDFPDLVTYELYYGCILCEAELPIPGDDQ